VKQNFLDFADEGRVINDAISDKRYDFVSTAGYAVPWIINGKVLRPDPFQRRHIFVEQPLSFRVIESANLLFY